ncbi:MAG: hypothetical protein HS104_31395 [Polyangiaceae bacterium]|nr:hypothetical protein [Polyangiaceae bacterium]MCL4750739.1 hypothetical protein [Myxococcales bacterium]
MHFSLRPLLCSFPLALALAVACGGDSESSSGGGGGSGGATGGSGGAATGGSGGSGGATGGSGGATGGSGGATGGSAGASGGSAGADASTGGAAGTDAGTDAPVDVGPDADPACATIPQTATVKAHLKITADNECEVFVNGTSVGTTNNWASAVTIDVSLNVHPSKKNVIAVKGTNTSSQAGNDRGIIGELTIDVADAGTAALVLTNASWKASKTLVAGWTDVTFDDSTWMAATEIANHGDGPWGNILTTTGAKWIWTGLIPAAVSDKPNLEDAYVRRAFYFDVSGAGISSQPGCP